MLAKIDMNEADLLKYEQYRKRVVTEIRQLRVVLETLEARKNERTCTLKNVSISLCALYTRL